MSSTPRRDAVQAWLSAGDWTAPMNLPPIDYDPCDAMSDDDRIDYAIAHAGSGVAAVLPRRSVIIDGKRIPEPPAKTEFKHGPRGRAPKPRKSRKTQPPKETP